MPPETCLKMKFDDVSFTFGRSFTKSNERLSDKRKSSFSLGVFLKARRPCFPLFFKGGKFKVIKYRTVRCRLIAMNECIESFKNELRKGILQHTRTRLSTTFITV